MKKKFFGMLVVISIILLSTGCSGNDNTTSHSSNSTEKIEQTQKEDEHIEYKTTQVYDDCFVELSAYIGQYTFEDCKKYLSDKGYIPEIQEPTDDQLGEFVIEDTNGFFVKATTMLEDNGKEILHYLQYSSIDENYYGYIEKSLFKNEIDYKTYSIDREPYAEKVDSVQAITDFLFSEAIQKSIDLSDAVSSHKPIDVSIDIQMDYNEGAPLLTLTTNLPDETELLYTFSDTQKVYQEHLFIRDGKSIGSDILLDGSKVKNGEYTLSITMIHPSLQNANVQKRIGTTGELLAGDLIIREDDANIVSAEYIIFFFDGQTYIVNKHIDSAYLANAKEKMSQAEDSLSEFISDTIAKNNEEIVDEILLLVGDGTIEINSQKQFKSMKDRFAKMLEKSDDIVDGMLKRETGNIDADTWNSILNNQIQISNSLATTQNLELSMSPSFLEMVIGNAINDVRDLVSSSVDKAIILLEEEGAAQTSMGGTQTGSSKDSKQQSGNNGGSAGGIQRWNGPSSGEASSSGATASQASALETARGYLNVSAFSFSGLVDQLEFEGYSTSDAEYAAEHCGADWNEQALKAAKAYLKIAAFSYSGLMGQLEFDGYTNTQATYGVDHCGADWNEQAAKAAQSYLQLMEFGRSELISQLEYDGYSQDQAEYGVSAVGL